MVEFPVGWTILYGNLQNIKERICDLFPLHDDISKCLIELIGILELLS